MFSLYCKPFVCPTSQIGDTAILSPPDHRARQVGTMGHHWDGHYSLRKGCVSLTGAATCIIFVATKVLLRQTRVCRDKTRLFSRQKYAYRDKHIFVATTLLSRQKICRDKLIFVATNTSFVATKICLVTNTCVSRQKYFVTTNIILSRDERFVAASILVAAPANDIKHQSVSIFHCYS